MSRSPMRTIAAYLLVAFLVTSLAAEDASRVPVRLDVPEDTPIQLRLAESVTSAHAHVGDRLDFTVVKDVSLKGFVVVKAGTAAIGSITAVKGRRLLGIGGRISLKLESLELGNGQRIALRASKDVKGPSRTKLMFAGMIATSLLFLPATPAWLLLRGHSSTVVKSTEMTARLSGPVSIPTATLSRSEESYSELAEMLEYLPPRVFNGEGREGDMVNLVFVGQQQDLQDAFQRAGWVETDDWKPTFAWHLLQFRNNDAKLPMARFYLFGRVQDYSYALPDPDAVVTRRHHIRVWRTLYAVNGVPIWAGSATHDVAIMIAKGGRLINHRIDPDVDAERDFVGSNLTNTTAVQGQEYVSPADPVYAAKTASGEAYRSDSRILFLKLHSSAVVGGSQPGAGPAGSRKAVPASSLVDVAR